MDVRCAEHRFRRGAMGRRATPSSAIKWSGSVASACCCAGGVGGSAEGIEFFGQSGALSNFRGCRYHKLRSQKSLSEPHTTRIHQGQ